MAHGGGTWLTQNKKLPGTYINFSSVARASAALSDRGVAACPFALSWGEVGKVIEVTNGDFQKDSMDIFGYDYAAPEMLYLREIFRHATKVLCYRLGTTDTSSDEPDIAQKASCDYATAKYPGKRGNDIKIVIEPSVDDTSKFVVKTYVGSVAFDTQTVAAASELVGNKWVDFNTATTLAATTGISLEGGSDGTSTAADYQDFLDAVEPYAFNALCCPTAEGTVVQLFEEYTERLRDSVGAKFQLVAFESNADYEGVIGVYNEASHPTISNVPKHALVYWVTGAEAGVLVNRSLTNTEYDGELTVDVSHKQSQLEDAIDNGRFMFHNVNGEVRVLEDINTLRSTSDVKGDDFKMNQTIRVCDQIANDVAVLFNTRYLGKVQNDGAGRGALWNDIVYYLTQLEALRAIENLNPDNITCEVGSSKKTVLLTVNGLYIVNAMSQLYMSVIIQ